ncbi:hypothetical protein [Clostridium perfringens]|uniref:hypothetical protein n=1 Tax=Clostridium perfringens TaxID=1502 RepID=UPI0030D0DA82|nr:hypothetical protein [Clostridium sp.]
MIFTNGEKVLGTVKTMPILEEGNHESEIKKVDYSKECKTDWGYKDYIDITYSVSVGVTEQLKKEKIMISQAENSKCYKLLLELYKGNVPKEINIKEWEGRRCVITIKHNVTEDGRVYANIVERKFD